MSESEGLFSIEQPQVPVRNAHDNSSSLTKNVLKPPLAVRMRPQSIADIYGQQALTGKNSPIHQIIAGNSDTSLILYGPPGTGKTTIAFIIAHSTDRHYESLSALNLTVKELRDHISMARHRRINGKKTVLFIDEVHRFSKNQQDALLDAVENGIIMLIAATTENPSFSIIAPLLSRSLIIPLEVLSVNDMENIIGRAIHAREGLADQVQISEENITRIAYLSGGDARKALTIVETAAQIAIAQSDHIDDDAHTDIPEITIEDIEQVIHSTAVRYDKDGDQHYDVISAFIKSLRGSDVDAALHYLARMIIAGEDPRFIARRLVIFASEDIGMADSQALMIAHSAYHSAATIGMPEARINLAHAVIYLALAPKSNAVICAIDSAMSDIKKGLLGQVPPHLRDSHYKGAHALGNGIDYIYPHNHPEGVVHQQYIPDSLLEARYYYPSQHGHEQKIHSRWEKLRSIIRGNNDG